MLQMKRKRVNITAQRGVSLLDRVRHCRSQCVTAGRGASLAPAPEIETPLSYSLAVTKVKTGFNRCSDYENAVDVNVFKCAV